MLKTGINGSPKPKPIFFTSIISSKNDETSRLCVDYRALNWETIKDKFPISVIDELLDELNGAKIFSKLDLRCSYHQIRLCPEALAKQLSELIKDTEFLMMP